LLGYLVWIGILNGRQFGAQIRLFHRSHLFLNVKEEENLENCHSVFETTEKNDSFREVITSQKYSHRRYRVFSQVGAILALNQAFSHHLFYHVKEKVNLEKPSLRT